MTDSHPHLASALLAGLLLVGACSDSAEPINSGPAVIQSYADRQAERAERTPAATSAATSGQTTDLAADSAATEDATPEAIAAPSVDSDAAGSPSPAAEPMPTSTPVTRYPATGGLPLSEWGLSLGCTDAFDLRSSLGRGTPAMIQAASPLRRDVWLCPNTLVVTSQLDCYPQVTAAVLDALEAARGESGKENVEIIRESGVIFCGSGDVLDLGIDAVLERIENDGDQ